jgi:radical SAM superfamily enzyme YgiQ (UPF0313 family)
LRHDATTRPICLTIPPSSFLLDERVFMSLGILRVAAALEGAGHRVELLDLSGYENFQDAVRDHAARTEAEVFGVTATTPQLPAAIAVARAVREVRPHSRLVLGGPHVTLVNAARRQEAVRGGGGRATRAFERLLAHFDVLVAGDGEDAVLKAIEAGSPRLVDADDPKSALFLGPPRLAELPMPARHLVDVDSYRYTIDGIRALSLICQLGCPFGCRFCGGRESPSLRRVRLRPSDSVVAEVLHLRHTYGVKGFMLYDDELNVNPKMVELMSSLEHAAAELGEEFRFRGFIKAELFDDRQAEAMYRAGFRWILTGFESGAPRILKNIAKRATVEDNTRCVEIAHRHGLKVKALMSLGHPGESRETIRETRDWLLAVKPDDFDVTALAVYPGTPYYDHAVPHETLEGTWVYSVDGDRLYGVEVDYSTVSDYYKGDPASGYTSYVYTDHLSADELVGLRDQVERDVRQELAIPPPPSAATTRYEHSMGQGGTLPPGILRSTNQAQRRLHLPRQGASLSDSLGG